MKPRQMIWYAFWLGIMFNAFWSLFVQDMLGQEAYLEQVRNHWWDIHWAVWIPFLSYTAYALHKLLRRVPE